MKGALIEDKEDPVELLRRFRRDILYSQGDLILIMEHFEHVIYQSETHHQRKFISR